MNTWWNFWLFSISRNKVDWVLNESRLFFVCRYLIFRLFLDFDGPLFISSILYIISCILSSFSTFLSKWPFNLIRFHGDLWFLKSFGTYTGSILYISLFGVLLGFKSDEWLKKWVYVCLSFHIPCQHLWNRFTICSQTCCTFRTLSLKTK